jgi:hypothetical protein
MAFLERRVFAQNTLQASDVITSPAEALNVLDFEEAAHRKVMAGHWACMVSSVDDDATPRANCERPVAPFRIAPVSSPR